MTTTSLRALLSGAFVCALLLAGCGGDGEQRTPEEIVAESAEKTAEVKSFRFTLSVTDVPPVESGLGITAATGEIVVPDRLKAKVSGTFSRIPIESELVIVGDDDFFLDPLTRKWRRLDIGTSPVEFFDPAKGVLGVIRGARELESQGSESVAGTDSYHLRGTVQAADAAPLVLVSADSERPVEVELWIGEDDLIVRRIRVNGPVADGEPAGATRTVELSDFGQTFEIEPPEVEG